MKIGFLGAGEMGSAMAAQLGSAGHDCAAVAEGRGAETLSRMSEAGMEQLSSLDELVAYSEIIFSVLPPQYAEPEAIRLADVIGEQQRTLVFVEANAVSPGRTRRIAAAFKDTSAGFVDGGIVGGPPRGLSRPRFYVSGTDTAALAALDAVAFDLIDLGPQIGDASGFKMAYAALTKGTNTLLTNVLLAGERLGVSDQLTDELRASQGALFARAENTIPRLPADAGRWVFEMQEIAATFRQLGLSGEFHDGAAEIMRFLAASEFGQETRRTYDRSRTSAETISRLAKTIK